MFESPLEVDEPLVLSDISPDIFSIMLQYIYTNCCKINPDNVSFITTNILSLCDLCKKEVKINLNLTVCNDGSGLLISSIKLHKITIFYTKRLLSRFDIITGKGQGS